MSEFNRFAPALGLKIGLSIGQTDFQKEQFELCGYDPTHRWTKRKKRGGSSRGQEEAIGAPGGCSKVDILVATPGRLMDHMEKTPGFTLQHLKYLVIDEVSRSVCINVS